MYIFKMAKDKFLWTLLLWTLLFWKLLSEVYQTLKLAVVPIISYFNLLLLLFIHIIIKFIINKNLYFLCSYFLSTKIKYIIKYIKLKKLYIYYFVQS